jgi:hypothetical protein
MLDEDNTNEMTQFIRLSKGRHNSTFGNIIAWPFCELIRRTSNSLMEEDWLVSLYLYGMHLHNLKHHHKKTKKTKKKEEQKVKGNSAQNDKRIQKFPSFNQFDKYPVG